jgi:hypothetical protein
MAAATTSSITTTPRKELINAINSYMGFRITLHLTVKSKRAVELKQNTQGLLLELPRDEDKELIANYIIE